MSRFLNRRLGVLEPYTPGEQPKNIQRLIKLNTNENPFPPGEPVKRVYEQTDWRRLRLYPQPDATGLIEAAAAVWGVEKDQIIAGNGSDEILAFCFQAFGDSGIAFPDITYGFYQVWAGLYGVTANIIPLSDDLSINIEDYAGAKGVVLIANPNAPTGQFLYSGAIRALLEQDEDRLVIVDEAYGDFAAESVIPLIDEYDNLLVVRTLSKGYSLAGARIGFAIGCAELIDDLRRVKYSFNPYNINSVSMAVAEAALKDREYFNSCRWQIIEERQRLTEALRDLGFKVEDSSANFIFPGENPRLPAGKWFTELRKYGIITRYFPGERTWDHLRITVGLREENDALLSATEEILEGGTQA